MIKNLITIALRKMARNKLSTVVNVVGLSLGISGALVIATLIRFEAGFNRSYPKFDRLYRIVTDEYPEGVLSRSGCSAGPVAQTLRDNFSDVETATLVFMDIDGQFTIRDAAGDRKFREKTGVARVTPEYFSMFDIPWISGDPKSLSAPGSIALTKSIAEKYFGTADPLGKTVRMNNAADLTVVGVLPDPPKTSDFAFSIYLSAANLRETDSWVFEWTNMSSNIQVFVLLRPGALPGPVTAGLRKITDEAYKQAPDPKLFFLQSLADTHYEPVYADTFRAVGRTTLAGLGLIGVFLLLTACVNFVNMATAQAVVRSREVGVRKVLGAAPKSIVLHFLGETLFIVAAAAAAALVIAEIITPVIADQLDIPVVFGFTDVSSLLLTFVLVVATTGIAGVYPAMMLSRFGPAAALKGAVSAGGLGLRRGLVVLQFAISQLLIIGTVVVTLQMQYVIGKDMGFSGDGILVTPLPLNDAVRLETFRTMLSSDPRILGVSFSYSPAISQNTWNSDLRYSENGAQKHIRTDLKWADTAYFKTYGLDIVAGRTPFASDTVREFVVNEAFTRKLGLADPAAVIGRTFIMGSREPMPVVGVVKDFNTQSLRTEINPCLIAPRTSSYREAGIRIQPADIAPTMARIENAWTAAFPEYVFQSEFLDQSIEKLYLQERRIEFLFRTFAVTAILIGCIGLFGLVSFVAARKTKEIGVRKVLGATVGNILGMFSKEFAVLILIAFSIAAPVGYVAMHAWLEDFAYRIAIGPLVFLAALSAIVVITGLTIGYRAIRAAGANPVESLRYE
jgi:ABC-type antimicrobial peptide transport system permease subunit